MDTQVKVSVIIENDKNEILLLKEKLPKKDRPLWNIVKGTYGDSGDESIFEAAIRECLEETSTNVKLSKALGSYITNNNSKIRVMYNFTARILSGKPKIAPIKEQKLRDESILELKWFKPENALELGEKEFVSKMIYKVIENYNKNEFFELEILKQIKK